MSKHPLAKHSTVLLMPGGFVRIVGLLMFLLLLCPDDHPSVCCVTSAACYKDSHPWINLIQVLFLTHAWAIPNHLHTNVTIPYLYFKEGRNRWWENEGEEKSR